MLLRGLTVICAALLALGATAASTTYLTEDFSTNPSNRWGTFGDTNLFQWDDAQGRLNVTWDSAQPKSLFYIPIPRTLGRYDDFSFQFDLTLTDIASGHEEGKTGPMQIGIGFLNIQATNDGWSRVEWGSSPNVAEFNAYPTGSYGDFFVTPTTAPSFVASSGYGYLSSLDDFKIALPLGQPVRVQMDYDAESQLLTAVWTTNGVPVNKVHRLVLGQDILFGPQDDFQVNIFSISSYRSNEGEYANSVLAHGSVDNIAITIPPPPVIVRESGFKNLAWDMTILTRPGWTYSLERSTNSSAWHPIVQGVQGAGNEVTLSDPAPPTGKAFYRIRAND